MPEITRRRTGKLLRKLFELLRGVPEGLQAKEALVALERAVSLTDYESGDYEKGGRRFDKIRRDAADEARTQEKRRVTLIDLDQLFELWVQYYEKLSDEARQRLPLKPIHFLAPAP